MEGRFGHDFSDVRVHTGERAAASAESVGALAYTVGRNVVFGAGYSPGSVQGRRLLAHELAHVVQQSSAPAANGAGERAAVVNDPSDRFERAADAVAEGVLTGQTQNTRGLTASSGGAPPLIQRQALPDVPDVTLRLSNLAARVMGALTLDGFTSDDATLTSDLRSLLGVHAQTILMLLRSYPGGTVQIVGHTDATATEAHNLKLGQRRADAVRDFLVSKGVPQEVIGTSSAGETGPRVPTKRAEPRNRRVEVRFVPEPLARFTPPLTLERPEMPTPSPDIDLTPRLEPKPETPDEKLQRILKTRVPERPRGPSINEALRKKLDEAVDSAMDGLGIESPFVREKVKDAAHAALEKAESAVLDAALDQTNLGSAEKRAIKEAIRGVLETKTP